MSVQPWASLFPAALRSLRDDGAGVPLEQFRKAAAGRGDRAALLYFDGVVSYAELDRDSDAMAAWLQDKGIGADDRVCVVAQNIPAFPLLCLAAWKLGAVPAPGNPMYKAAELGRILADMEPAALLCQDTEAEEVAAALAIAGLAGIPVIVASAQDHQRRGDARVLPPAAPNSHGETLSSILATCRGRGPRDVAARTPEDLGLILYTSGTTGIPKGAMLRNRSLAYNADIIRLWCDLAEEDRIWAMAPLFHITGFVCHICAAFSAGCTMVLTYRFDPAVALDIIREHRPTFTIGAITALNALSRAPGVTANDMQSLTKVWSGGAPIPPALRDTIQQRLGFVVNPSYGMTELTSPAVLAPAGHPAPIRDDVLSIGIPIPLTDIRIADEAGQPVAPGEIGEILVRGPQVMAGYWRKPEDSEAALRDGWMHSGDMGFMDADGWIFLVDRKKDMIIASGFKVWPREVEDVLYTHPAVREAAVIGVPDGYRGETVMACVSLAAAASATEAELAAYCRERLAAYKVPRLVRIMADLPKTVTGKIQRSELRQAAS